jgi:hypothetical protein
LVRVILLALHNATDEIEFAAGAVSTVAIPVLRQPVDVCVNVTGVVPVATPVIAPVPETIVATLGVPTDHVPLPGPLVSRLVTPSHTVRPPPIGAGRSFTVIVTGVFTTQPALVVVATLYTLDPGTAGVMVGDAQLVQLSPAAPLQEKLDAGIVPFTDILSISQYSDCPLYTHLSLTSFTPIAAGGRSIETSGLEATHVPPAFNTPPAWLGTSELHAPPLIDISTDAVTSGGANERSVWLNVSVTLPKPPVVANDGEVIVVCTGSTAPCEYACRYGVPSPAIPVSPPDGDICHGSVGAGVPTFVTVQPVSAPLKFWLSSVICGAGDDTVGDVLLPRHIVAEGGVTVTTGSGFTVTTLVRTQPFRLV